MSEKKETNGNGVKTDIPSLGLNDFNASGQISSAPTNTWADQIDSALAESGKKYDYKSSEDALYNSYKDSYMTEAQKMRNDVVKTSKGVGFDSQSVADQQYQTYMTEIGRLQPTFEALAYEKYQGGINDNLNKAQYLKGLEDTQYSMDRDKITDEQTYRDYELGKWQDETERQLTKDEIASAEKEADWEYYLGKYQDDINRQAANEIASTYGYGSGYSYDYEDYGDLDAEPNTVNDVYNYAIYMLQQGYPISEVKRMVQETTSKAEREQQFTSNVVGADGNEYSADYDNLNDAIHRAWKDSQVKDSTAKNTKKKNSKEDVQQNKTKDRM